jgi:hypothetical protein
MKKLTRPKDKAIVVVLIKRTVIFYLGLCVLTIFLYGIGTNQGFMDKTQLMLLNLSIVLGICLGTSACYGIVLDIVMMCQGKFRYLNGIVFYIILVGVGLALAAFSTFIIVLTQGNAGGPVA